MSAIKPPPDWLVKLCNETFAASSSPEGLSAAGASYPPYFFRDPFTNNVAVIAATLFCWEYLMTMPSEIGIYFTIPWTAPHLILFVLMRYSTMTAISLGVYSTWHRQRGHCVAYGEIATLLVQLSVSSVLGWRTIAIWQKDARIIVIVSLLLVTLMVFSTLLVLSMKAQKQPNGTCALVEGGNYEFFPLAWFYAGTVMYDKIVTVLSTYRLWQHHKDVGFFPGANADDTSKGGIGWAGWIHSQWTSITPLLFRMTSNGLLYLAFSTVFNTVCFIIGFWNQSHAQDLMTLYSSVMWVVCQRLVLLEIKSTWGDRPTNGDFGSRDAKGNDETDRLIAQILQASFSTKAPPPNSGKTSDVTDSNKDPEIVLSLSVDSCLRETPNARCQAKCARTHARQHSLGRSLNDDLGGELSVQQLHDFRPCMPGDAEFSLKSAAADSERSPMTDGDRSTSALINPDVELGADETKSGTSLRQRIGALRATPSPTKLLATLTKTHRPGTGESSSVVVVGEVDHPLKDTQPRDSLSRFHRLSHPFERMPKKTIPPTRPKTSPDVDAACTCCCNTPTPPRREEPTSAGNATSSLEVEDMLANMSDEAKAQALELAGMESAGHIHASSSFTSILPSPRAKTNKSTWIIHPPL